MKFVCDVNKVSNWSNDQKADFIRWYESSRWSAKMPGAKDCYDACKA